MKAHFPHRNIGPRWDRFNLTEFGYNGELAEKRAINRETAPELDHFGETQLVVFADGHIRKLTTRMSENEFRKKHEPGKPKNKVGN